MDIDLDFKQDFNPKDYFPTAISASIVKNEQLVKHPCGCYFQNIPIDLKTNLSAIPHKRAGEFGYFKIDFLHVSVLDPFKSKQEIRELSKLEPDWDLLLDPANFPYLTHLKDHYELVNQVKPRSVIELADCLALIRPGKRQFVKEYLKDAKRVRRYLYDKTDQYYFKRSHAVAYSLTIVTQLHLISQGRL